MWPGKIIYYGEFIFYAAVIAGLAAVALWQAPPDRSIIWLAAFTAGIWLWTLVEYLLHRYVLHHVPHIKEMHQAHHDEQDALIGTPVWISFGSFAVFLVLPAWFLMGPTAAAGLTAGMMLGYVWFGGVHHVLHHWRQARHLCLRPEAPSYAPSSFRRRWQLRRHHRFLGRGLRDGCQSRWHCALWRLTNRFKSCAFDQLRAIRWRCVRTELATRDCFALRQDGFLGFVV